MELPPGLPPRPDLGRLMMAAGFVVTPARFLDRCQEACGDFFTLRPQPGRWVVLTSDPATVKEVFTGDPALLHAGAGNVVLEPILGTRSVLLLDGAEHMRQRKLLLPPFHGERMRLYGDVMAQAAQRAIALAARPSLRGAAGDAGRDAGGDPACRLRHQRCRARAGGRRAAA